MKATKYVAKKAISRQNSDLGEDIPISVLSAGGMSAQIAYASHRVSLRFDAIRSRDAVRKTWVESGGADAVDALKRYSDDIKDKVEACIIEPGTLGGSFVGIEMFGYFGTGESSADDTGIFPDVSLPGKIFSLSLSLSLLDIFLHKNKHKVPWFHETTRWTF